MGKVYLLGAGPGDKDLITVKGMELLKSCDVVLYDKLASYQLLDYVKKDCIKVYVGKEAGHHSKSQAEINRILKEHAESHDVVVRLKGGDPFVFGRGGEEIEELMKNHLPYEIVSGVTSAVAVPASAGIPVTHRGVSQSFHVITGRTQDSRNTLTENYDILAKLNGTLIFLMGLSNLKEIVHNLVLYGKSKETAAAVISNGTLQSQKTVRGTLDTIAGLAEKEKLKPPVVIVIGEAAKLNYRFNNEQKLNSIRIGLTGTECIRKKLREELERAGFQVIDVCDMKIDKTSGMNDLRKELADIKEYQWIVFTSSYAVQYFFEAMSEENIDHRQLADVKFGVIGSGSKEALKKYGFIADLIPDKYSSRDLGYQLLTVVRDNERVLIPRALQGSRELAAILNDGRIQFKEIPIYDAAGKIMLHNNFSILEEIDCNVFVSPSGVDAFFEQLKKHNYSLPLLSKIACIGQLTADAVIEKGCKSEITAGVSDVSGLAGDLKDYYMFRPLKQHGV